MIAECRLIQRKIPEMQHLAGGRPPEGSCKAMLHLSCLTSILCEYANQEWPQQLGTMALRRANAFVSGTQLTFTLCRPLLATLVVWAASCSTTGASSHNLTGKELVAGQGKRSEVKDEEDDEIEQDL